MKKKIIGFGLTVCLSTAILFSNMGNVEATGNSNTTSTQQTQTTDNNNSSSSSSNSSSNQTNTLANNAKFTVDGKELVITENLNPSKYPTGFSETKVECKGKKYKGLKFDKADISMICLLNQQSGAAAYYIYQDDTESVYPFLRIQDGENFIFALPEEMADSQAPEGYTAAELEQEEGAEDTSVYLLYAMNQDGEKSWYEYQSEEKTYTEYKSDGEEVAEGEEEEEISDTEYLGKQYTQLEEKYKKDKNKYRMIIAILVFMIAVLLVLWINTLLKVRQYKDWEEDEEYEEDEYEEEGEEEYEEEYYDEDEPEEFLDEPVEEPVQKPVQEPKKKYDYDSDIEVLDLNDL